jgi:hypothetical protein
MTRDPRHRIACAWLRFLISLAGFFSYCTVATALGRLDPFWHGGKGLFIPMLGIPMLFLASAAYFVWLGRIRVLPSSWITTVAGFLDGICLFPAIGIATEATIIAPVSALPIIDVFTFVVVPLLLAVITTAFVSCLKSLQRAVACWARFH